MPHNFYGSGMLLTEMDEKQAWDDFLASAGKAVQRMDELTQGLTPEERADGFRVLTRTLGAAHEILEMDRVHPEPVPHNQWNAKFLMDNPDGKYWLFELDAAHAYRLSGNLGDAAYTSISVYRERSAWHDTEVAATINGAELSTDRNGDFDLFLGGERQGANWLPLDPDARTVWIRQFFNDVHNERPSRFAVRNLDPAAPAPLIEPALLADRLTTAGKKLRSMTSAIRHARDAELSRGNHVRDWTEMMGGAVFTSSDILYQRGAWDLASDEALVLEGHAPPAVFWNIVLYSRFLNSLEHRYRQTSLTGAKIETNADGRYRLVLAAEKPGAGDWLDTEGRAQGMFALRWVSPEAQPDLPTATVMKLKDLQP